MKKSRKAKKGAGAYKKTNGEYAEEYGCTIRTITRYRAQGLPLDNPEAMREALAGQKHRPKGAPENVPEGEISQSEANRRRTIAQWKKMEFQLEVERGKYTENGKVIEGGYSIGASVGSALDKLSADLPALLLGLDESAMSASIRAETDKIRQLLADQISALAKKS